MKLVKTFLIAGILVASTSFAAAPDASTPAPEANQAKATTLTAEPVADQAVAKSADCEKADGVVLVESEWQKPTEVSQNCGACSSSNCVGVPRGQRCHLGIGGGWGHCNIFSGGYICSTGGWECSCSGGVLP